MFTTLDELIMARAAEMAGHDGDPLSIVHIMGAASLLQGELISARDRLLAKPAGSAHEPGVPDASALEPIADPEPEESPVEDFAPGAEPEVEEVSPAKADHAEPAPIEDAAK